MRFKTDMKKRNVFLCELELSMLCYNHFISREYTMKICQIINQDVETGDGGEKRLERLMLAGHN